MNLILPVKKGIQPTSPTIDFTKLVVVGANGSGKTRFGSYIELQNLARTHRISAQKSLTFPREVRPTSISIAESDFLYGVGDPEAYGRQDLSQYKRNRYGNKDINTSMLDDFSKLLVLLHTEEYHASLKYRKENGVNPTTKMDKVQAIWEALLPHRKLVIGAGIVEVYPTGSVASTYNASDMSDGERVIFYLIGEIVCAAPNSIIIVDEPESHIHKSLVKTLFDLVEVQRLDCAFIYLTHDIDFAISRQEAIKIWTKNYEGNNVWDYEILSSTSPIPEQLYLEVLGSRKPILFLEGEDSSIDYKLYPHVFTEYTIKPLGSCRKVIDIVKSFNEQNGFHHIQSFGIIDRDRRLADDITSLNADNIWVLDVAEAENLMLSEAIIKAIAQHNGQDPHNVFNEVQTNLLQFFESVLDYQVLEHFKEALRRKMKFVSNFGTRQIADALLEVDASYQAIDKQALYDSIKAEFQDIIDTRDYNGLLRVFNIKNALIPKSNVLVLTGVRTPDHYLNLVIMFLKRNDEVSNSIKAEVESKILKAPVVTSVVTA